MKTKLTYDITGAAASLSGHIYQVGSQLLATIGGNMQAHVKRHVVAARIAEIAQPPFGLQDLRTMAKGATWESFSLQVASIDAEFYYGRLREVCVSATTDEQFIVTVKNIALSMVGRDHAQRVALKLKPNARAANIKRSSRRVATAVAKRVTAKPAAKANAKPKARAS